MFLRILGFTILAVASVFSQAPPPDFAGPGVSHDLAIWRAAHYSEVRYKLNLTLEKMSPVLKGTVEIRVNASPGTQAPSPATTLDRDNADARGARAFPAGGLPIILDWRKLVGHEKDSTISNVTLNGIPLIGHNGEPFTIDGQAYYIEDREHLIFGKGVKTGENVIKLDFTSPILTSGSAITRYVDKEDGAEYIYSLFVPSDASTAFPVFDQPDLKARFQLNYRNVDYGNKKSNVKVVSNTTCHAIWMDNWSDPKTEDPVFYTCDETKPISTYVFAFAAGPFAEFGDSGGNASVNERALDQQDGRSNTTRPGVGASPPGGTLVNTRVSARVFVRKSQAEKFKPHAADVFRLTREGIKYLETYFDYKFPFPKYDLVLIPEFPFGGMEHAGATFLRESSVIFPSEPTKSDYISRATLIFHETAHQWFGDTVTMKWFDDLWLKEGFANFMAYKALEKIMPEANAWKVFYERIKQPAYATDSTRGTTAIYQPIANLSAAKSAYGNIVYNKAPAFLRQAEFYLGEDKFQTAVRTFLKKHEFANAGWEDLVTEFETASGQDLKEWASVWVQQKGLPGVRLSRNTVESTVQGVKRTYVNYGLNVFTSVYDYDHCADWHTKIKILFSFADGVNETDIVRLPAPLNCVPYHTLPTSHSLEAMVNGDTEGQPEKIENRKEPGFAFPNYQDYGYGIFLLDEKSRDYVLKNIQNEKDPFLRSMMWGSLWDSVREGELDPRAYVELVVKNLATEPDETIVSSILGRVATAMNYYMDDPASGGNASVNERALSEQGGRPNASRRDDRDSGAGGTLVNTRVSARDELRSRLESLLIDRMQNAEAQGQRITFFRALVSNATTAKASEVLKRMLTQGGNLSGSEGAQRGTPSDLRTLPTGRVSASGTPIALRTKDKFDIVTRLTILGDPDAPKLLADLEKTETSDDAKRYAYAAHAAFATKENREKFWNDFVNNKDISESWIEAAMGPFNSIRHDDLSLPYLQRALAELPDLKRSRKIFFVNGWLGAFIDGQRSEEALNIVNKFLADNSGLDKDLRLKILENVDLIERAVKIRAKFRWRPVFVSR